MAALRFHIFRCRRWPGRRQTLGERRWLNRHFHVLTTLSRSYQLTASRTFHAAASTAALLQEWRTTPRLQLRGVFVPVVVLQETRSDTTGEDTHTHPNGDYDFENAPARLREKTNAKKIAYSQSDKLISISLQPASYSAIEPLYTTLSAATHSSMYPDAEGKVLYSEEDIGAGAFVTRWGTRRGLHGIMRYRSEDFVVREIGRDGRMCEFPATKDTVLPDDTNKRDNKTNVSLDQNVASQPQYVQCSPTLWCESGAVSQQCRRHPRESTSPTADCGERASQRNTNRQTFVTSAGLGSAHMSQSNDNSADCVTGASFTSFASRPERIHSQQRAREVEYFSFKFVLGKRNRETPEALEMISRATGIPVESFSFAGMKDRRAVTLQWVSCKVPSSLSLSTGLGRLSLPPSCRNAPNRDTCLTASPRTSEARKEKSSRARRLPHPGAEQPQSPGLLSGRPEIQLYADVTSHSISRLGCVTPFTKVENSDSRASVRRPPTFTYRYPREPGGAEENADSGWTERCSGDKYPEEMSDPICAKEPDTASLTRSSRCSIAKTFALSNRGSDPVALSNAAKDANPGTACENSDDPLVFGTSTYHPGDPPKSSLSLQLLPENIKFASPLKTVHPMAHCLASAVPSTLEKPTGRASRIHTPTDFSDGFRREFKYTPEVTETSEVRLSHRVSRNAVVDWPGRDNVEGHEVHFVGSGKENNSTDTSRGESRRPRCQTDVRTSTTRVSEKEAGPSDAGYYRVEQMEEFAKKAMAHPLWDPCVSWGKFRYGHVYLGDLQGNNFTILLRSLQVTPCTPPQPPASRRKVDNPVCNPESLRTVRDLATPRLRAEREGTTTEFHAEEWREQDMSQPVESTDISRFETPRRQKTNNLRDCTNTGITSSGVAPGEAGDDHVALLEEVRGAAVKLTEKGFVNYFGPQRFGTGARPTFHIGRALLRRQYNLACHLIMQIPTATSCTPAHVDDRGLVAAPPSVFRVGRCSIGSTLEGAGSGAEGTAQAKVACSRPSTERIARAPSSEHEAGATPATAAIEKEFISCTDATAPSTWNSQLGASGSDVPDSFCSVQVSNDPGVVTTCSNGGGTPPKLPKAHAPQQRTSALPIFGKEIRSSTVLKHERAYTAAQEAYWRGNFWQAYTLLPKSFRLERQLLRRLAASPYVKNASWKHRAVRPEQEGESVRNAVASEGQVLTPESDVDECVNAVELAAAGGAATEGAGRRAALLVARQAGGPRLDTGCKVIGPARTATGGGIAVPAAQVEGICAEESVGKSETECNEATTRFGDVQVYPFCWFGGAALAPRDAVRRAICGLPRLQRLMYVKAYAAYLWNKCATERVRLYGADQAVPGDLVLMPEWRSSDATVNVKNIEADLSKGSMPVSNSKPRSESLSEGGGRSSRVRILTEDDYAEFQARDVVLPLIGVGAVLPRNAVGDYMAALLRKEGLTESLYQRESEYFLDVVYRPLISHPRDFCCELLHLPLDFSGVVSDHFLKSQLRGSTTCSGGSNAPATQLDTVILQENGAAELASKQDPVVVWSFSADEVRGRSRAGKDPEVGIGMSDSCRRSAVGLSSCYSTNNTEAINNRTASEGSRNTDGDRTKVAVQTRDNFKGHAVQRKAESPASDEKRDVDSIDFRRQMHGGLYVGGNYTGAQRSQIGLLLRFTLDAGVFASSALREFMHCPFLHPFAQRRTENRHFPERVKVKG